MSILTSRVSDIVVFVKFVDSELWYKCSDGFEFPVPVSDTAGATFESSDKGLFFMRWIRKHMEMINKAKSE